MKRAYWLYGLLILALGSCSGEDEAKEDSPGQVSSEKTLVELVRVEGIAANGVDSAIVRLIARDAAGRAIPNREVEARSSNPTDHVSYAPVRTDRKGVAEIHVTGTEVGTRVLSLMVHSLSLPQRPTLTFVPGEASYLEFVETPGAGQAGRPLRPAVRVEIKDERGNRVVDADTEIALHVGSGEPQVQAAVEGVATFSDVIITEPGESHVLRATGQGLEDALSDSIEVVVGKPSLLTFEREPQDAEVGERISLSVAVRDPAGNVVVGSNDLVRVRLYSNPTAAKLEGTLEVQAVEGIATFDDLLIRKNSAGYQLTASARGYQSAESRAFTVGALRPDGSRSSFTVSSMDPEQADAVAVADGRQRLVIQGRILDVEGNPMPGFPVQLLATGVGHRFHPSQVGEGSTLDLRTSGTGSFTAWISSTVAETKQVTLRVGDLFELDQVVTFLPDAENDHHSELVPSVVSAVADLEDSITFEVVVRDGQGNPVPGSTVAISASGTGHEFPSGTTKVADAEGKALFSLISSKAESKTVTARVGMITLTNEVHFIPGPPNRAASIIHPNDQAVNSTATVGSTLPNPFRVIVRDKMNNPVPGATVLFDVMTDRARQDGSGGATLSDTVVVADEDGVAETTLSLGVRSGTNVVRWMAWSEGTPREDLVATGRPDVAVQLVLTQGEGQEGAAGTALPVALSFQARDRFDNPTGPLQINFQGDGSTSPASANIPGWTPSGSMTANVTWILRGNPVGANQLTAYATNPVPQQPDLTVQVNAMGTAGAASKLVRVGATTGAGVVGSQLTAPFTVQVLDAKDNIVTNASVEFVSNSASGSFDSPTGISDATGHVSATYTLGTNAGTQTVTARGVGWTAAANATFAVTAAPDDAATVAKSGSIPTSGMVATQLTAMQVTVTDRHGNPVPNEPVAFAITANAGPNATLTAASANTATNGTASTRLTLGSVPGIYEVTATVAGLPPVVFSVTATPGDPAELIVVSGSGQEGTVAQGIAQPLVVRVVDNQGNLLDGRAVTFSGPTGTQFSAASVNTGANGEASTMVTQLPQTAGALQVTAAVNTLRGTFNLVAVADDPYSLDSASGGGQPGIAGTELALPLRVRVLDQFDNPVQNRPVEFLSVSGGTGHSFRTNQAPTGANPAIATTDATGFAQAYWTLPNVVGPHTAMVDVAGVASGVTFRVNATLGAPAQITVTQAPGAPVPVDGTVTIEVEVRDTGGNLLDGADVNFSIASGTSDATVQDASVLSSGGGRAATTVSVGTVAGALQVDVVAGDAQQTITIDVEAGAADAITVHGGNGQRGVVGAALSADLEVLVVDAHGNPVSGADVGFTSADGTPGAALVATGTDGVAGTTFTPEALGSITVTASVASSTLSVGFTVTGLLDADQFLAVAGDQQYTDSGDRFGNLLVVRVLDGAGAPVANAAVDFAVDPTEGEIDSADPFTDTAGYATAWVSADAAHVGDVVVTATLQHSDLSDLTFTLTAGAEALCHTSGSSYFRPASTPTDALWAAAGVYSAGSAGTAGADGYADLQVRLVEVVAGTPALGLVVDAVAIRCDVDDDGTMETTTVELLAGATTTLLVDGTAQDPSDPLPGSVTLVEDPVTGFIHLGCAGGPGLRVLEIGGDHFASVLVDGASLAGGFCAEPAVVTDLAPGLFTVVAPPTP